MTHRRHLLTVSCLVALAGQAQAQYYPYYSGASHVMAPGVYSPSPDQVTLPQTIVPARYYTPGTAPMPVMAPVAYTVPAPAPLAPLPAPAMVAAATPMYAPPPAPTPVYAAPAPAYTAPAYYPPAAYPPPATAPGYAASNRAYATPGRDRSGLTLYTLGVDAYYDRYEEPGVNFDVDNRGVFGSLEYGVSHYFDSNWFGTLDGRSSYGRTAYKSFSGKVAQITEGEFDHRVTGGYDFTGGSDCASCHMKPYIGLGVRYFDDEFKDQVTNSIPPATGYDRRILQFYVPMGLAYEFETAGLHMAPVIEFDPLLWGLVESRFQNLGLPQATNHQHDGFGIRGEWMVGQTDSQGRGWQAGPYFRYWHISDSDPNDCNGPAFGPGFCAVEPDNRRTQLGASLRYSF